MMIVVFENIIALLTWIFAKQWVKKLKDRKMMDPETLHFLLGGVRVTVLLKGGNDTNLKLTMILCGGRPKFI